MSVLLLRKMTFKSIIGFGRYPDLTVQEVIDIGKMSELVSMYYSLDRIDFIQEVKTVLCIEIEIPKPGKIEKGIKGNVAYDCVKRYIELKKQGGKMEMIRIGNMVRAENKQLNKKAVSREKWASSKSTNKGRNQK